MNLGQIYSDLKDNGIVVKLQHGNLYFSPKDTMPMALLDMLRIHKESIINHLSNLQHNNDVPLYFNPPKCRNLFTPHSTHENPWECDPESCYCYKEFRYPYLCQGVPCRWVWPNGIPDKE